MGRGWAGKAATRLPVGTLAATESRGSLPVTFPKPIPVFHPADAPQPEALTCFHLQVKRKKERRLVQPEDTNFSAHLTEAQRAITLGKVDTALSCAQKVCHFALN